MSLDPSLAFALAVLGDGPARYSNLTAPAAPTGALAHQLTNHGRRVHHASADRLVKAGLATLSRRRMEVTITDEGRQALAIEQAYQRVSGRRR